MNSYEAVHQALFDALTAALAPLGCAVYDRPPPKAAMPVAKMANHFADPDDAFGDRYTVHRRTIEIHTGEVAGSTGVERSMRQARLLLDAAKTALHGRRLTLSAGVAVRCVVERTNVDWTTEMTGTESSLIVRVDVFEADPPPPPPPSFDGTSWRLDSTQFRFDMG